MAESPVAYEPTATESVSETVVRALADAKDVDPTALDVRLYDAIDPDALDRFFDAGTASLDARLSFTVADQQVVVDNSRTVYLTDGHSDLPTANPKSPPTSVTPWPTVFDAL